MLNLNQLMDAQRSGGGQIEGLSHDDMVILQNYCLLAAQNLITTGAKDKRGVTDIALNAFRNGVALGLATKVEQGKLVRRSNH